jgi:hypothetical protein
VTTDDSSKDIPFPRPDLDPGSGLIDYAVGRCRELADPKAGDDGQGHFVIARSRIGFRTNRGREWNAYFDEIANVDVKKGLLGRFVQGMVLATISLKGGRVFHVRCGSMAAANLLNVLNRWKAEQPPASDGQS